jgi:hypothetical protein
VVDEEVLAREVGDDGVVARPDPLVAVRRDDDGAANAGLRHRLALAVAERPLRAFRSPYIDAVARRRTGAAVRRGAEEVVVAVALDDVGALVAVVYGDHRRLPDRALPVG